jgi:amino acid transporter
MGAGIMFSHGITPSTAAAVFSEQLIALYGQTLGRWAGVLAGAAAFIAILTSLLTVVDGGPRSIIAAIRSAFGLSPVPDDKPLDRTVGYFVSVTVFAIVAITIITLLTASFSAYLDFGAGVAFVIAPIIAFLNHLTVFRTLPKEQHPSALLKYWSLLGILIMAGVAIAYLRIAY